MLIQKNPQAFTDNIVNNSLDFTVSQFGLGLAFKLGIRDLDTDYTGQALPHIITGQILSFGFMMLLFRRIINDTGESRAES